jgi:cytochrome P450
VSTLVESETDGRTFADGEVVGMFASIFIGGSGTTGNLITNTIWSLLEYDYIEICRPEIS